MFGRSGLGPVPLAVSRQSSRSIIFLGGHLVDGVVQLGKVLYFSILPMDVQVELGVDAFLHHEDVTVTTTITISLDPNVLRVRKSLESRFGPVTQ